MQPIPNPSANTMMARGERVKDRVFEILEAHPQARGDDTILIWRYLRKHTDVRLSFNDFNALLYCTSFETIRRRRQELQAEHPELKPSERVKRKRARLQAAMTEHYRQTTIDTYAGMEG